MNSTWGDLTLGLCKVTETPHDPLCNDSLGAKPREGLQAGSQIQI